jgi:hypothetical protein
MTKHASMLSRRVVLVLLWPAAVLALVGVFLTFWPDAASGSPVSLAGLTVLLPGLGLLMTTCVLLGRYTVRAARPRARLGAWALLLAAVAMTVCWVAASGEHDYEQRYPLVQATVTGCEDEGGTGEGQTLTHMCLHHAVVNGREVAEWHSADRKLPDGRAVRVRANPVTGHLKLEVWNWGLGLYIAAGLIGAVAFYIAALAVYHLNEAWRWLRWDLSRQPSLASSSAAPTDAVPTGRG